MKKILVLSLLIMCFTSCEHKKEGHIVKDAAGNLYKLRQAVSNESYFLESIDTIELKELQLKYK